MAIDLQDEMGAGIEVEVESGDEMKSVFEMESGEEVENWMELIVSDDDDDDWLREDQRTRRRGGRWSMLSRLETKGFSEYFAFFLFLFS